MFDVLGFGFENLWLRVGVLGLGSEVLVLEFGV